MAKLRFEGKTYRLVRGVDLLCDCQGCAFACPARCDDIKGADKCADSLKVWRETFLSRLWRNYRAEIERENAG